MSMDRNSGASSRAGGLHLGFVASLAALIAVLALTAYLLLLQLIPPGLYSRAFLGIAALASGLLATRALSSYIASLSPKLGKASMTVANVTRIVGYTLSGLAALSLFVEAGIGALAGGTFAGLVVGLASQQTLGNFFAGLYILLTRFVEPGKEIRLLTPQVPFQPVLFPAYKHFSADFLLTGITGTVREVGLFYTVMMTETGLLLKLPNSLVLSSAVVDVEGGRGGTYTVRYEFSEELDPDIVLAKAKEALADLRHVKGVHINEQSDKAYYILRIGFSCDEHEDWRQIKSEILRRMIKLKAGLMSRAPGAASNKA